MAFLGSAALGLTLVALAPRLAGEGGALPPWGFLALVVFIDVAHVYATLYRTYFDRAEIARRPYLYGGVPLACFAVGVALHSVSHALFWTVLAYVALTHFVRQQIGWVAIYRARAGRRSNIDRVLDDAVTYAAALYPVLVWHASLPRAFEWFVEGDFVVLPIASVLPIAKWIYAALLVAYAARAVHRAISTRVVETGKHLVVATTAATWYVGIVATNSDFAFTAANVISHGVPYVVLLFMYARAKGPESSSFVRGILRRGFVAFVAVLQMLAFAEEMIWDRLVWHGHEGIFGWVPEIVLSDAALALIVPLLAVPQATHYVLDAVLWRRRDTGAAQARAMGFSRG
ncbi:MAG: hypothetical protein HOW73_04635 [Polyangiaceae bacterium]|nr:hypothetical protein [Polyangiaceae bacterium]